ncbi:hypothetical protein PF002_g28423 [Phytophthora fragariae]|uniref:Uncharacterized protein n=1 Tax=Phytophthora fragariae TaxID=53985 RepID=A0A6A3W6Y7_9STRA|nr:hypothetical protein PF002_g28423 [Phytophthora fragariae]
MDASSLSSWTIILSMVQARTGGNGCRLSLLPIKGRLLLTKLAVAVLQAWQCCRPGELSLCPWPLDMHDHMLILNSAAPQAPNQRAPPATSPKSCMSERDSLQRATSSSTVLSTTTRSTSGGRSHAKPMAGFMMK